MPGGMVPIELITNANPAYLRSDLGDLSELLTDIKRRGQKAPIIVDQTYLVLDGARRLEVAKKLGRREIYTVATKDFNLIRDLMIEARERHEKGDIHKPKSFLDYMELIPILRGLYAPIARSQAVATKRSGGSRASNEKYRKSGVTQHMSQMFGISVALIEQFSRAANILNQARNSRRPGLIERVLTIVSECEAAGTPFPLPERMKKAMQDPVPPRVTNANIVREQKGRITRAFSALEGAILAIPGIDDLDPGHAIPDLEAWFTEAGRHAMTLRMFRSAIKEQIDKTREESDQ